MIKRVPREIVNHYSRLCIRIPQYIYKIQNIQYKGPEPKIVFKRVEHYSNLGPRCVTYNITNANNVEIICAIQKIIYDFHKQIN